MVPLQDRSHDVLVEVDSRVEREEANVGCESYDDLQEGEVRSAANHQIEGGEARKPAIAFRGAYAVHASHVARVDLEIHI